MEPTTSLKSQGLSTSVSPIETGRRQHQIAQRGHTFECKGDNVIVRLPNALAIMNNVRNMVKGRGLEDTPLGPLYVRNVYRHISRHGVHGGREHQEKDDNDGDTGRGDYGPGAPVTLELPCEPARRKRSGLLVKEYNPVSEVCHGSPWSSLQ